jgi:HK97 family phage major capsid protein
MSHSETMRAQRSAKKAQLDALTAVAEARDEKSFTDAEGAEFDGIIAEIRAADARIVELDAIEASEARAAQTRVDSGEARTAGGATVTDPEVYAKGNYGQSFLRDLAKSRLQNDPDATDRLRRHAAADKETRALGNTNTTGGSGGEFSPPSWLIADFVQLARPGYAVAGLYNHSPMPSGVSSIMLPKILTGTTVAVQTTQNTALSQTDLTTGFVGTGITTIGGKEVVSQQLLDQSGIDFDTVIKADLAGAWGQTFGAQVMAGAGTGVNNNSVLNGLQNAVVPAGNQSTFTSASPTAALFYSKAAGMLASFATNRFAEPTQWVMHPRRWYWLLAQVDTAGRPLVVPDAILADAAIRAMNPIAANTGSPVQVVGAVGMFLGLPVVIDPNVPTNLGAGTNQDEVFLLKTDDLWLYESAPVVEVFNQPFADSMGVLYRIYSYTGILLNRQTSSIATMNGTGLIAPTF